MVDDQSKRKIFQEEIYFRVKAGDIIDTRKLYSMMHEWFVEQEYAGDDGEFPERYMWERRDPDKYAYICWRFHKQPSGEAWFNRTCDVDMKFIGIKPTEAAHNGQKFKVDKGTVEVKTWWYLEYDVDMSWRNHWFLKHFVDIYVNRMFKRDFEKHRIEVMREAEDFQACLKEYFKLFSFKSGSPRVKRVMNIED